MGKDGKPRKAWGPWGSDGDPVEGWRPQGEMGTPERDWEPGEGQGPWGGVRTLGRDRGLKEGWGLQRGTPERTETSGRDVDPLKRWGPIKDGDARKGWGPQKGREIQGRDDNPREWERAEPFLPPCHMPQAGSFPHRSRPALLVTGPCHPASDTAQEPAWDSTWVPSPPTPQLLCFSTFLPNSQAPRVQGSSNPGVAPPCSPHTKGGTAA